MEEDLRDLLAVWLGGDLDGARRDILLARLRTDAAFRRAFVAEIALLGQLRVVQSADPRWLQLEDVVGWSSDAGGADKSLEDAVMGRVAAPPARRVGRRWWWGGAAAAAVLLACAFFIFRGDTAAAGEVARVVELTGTVTVGADGAPATVGQELPPGLALVTADDDSFAVVEYADRTRLELYGNTAVRFSVPAAAPGKRVAVERGYVWANVTAQPPGAPFRLQTAQLDVTVRGTSFTTQAGADETRVDVEQGAVDVALIAGGSGVEVPAGMYVLAAPAAPTPLRVRTLSALPVRLAEEVNVSAVGGAGVFTPDGASLVTEKDGWIELRQPTTRVLQDRFDGGLTPITALVTDQAGATLAGCAAGRIRLWDLPTRRVKQTIVLAGNEGVSRLALAPAGDRVAAVVRVDREYQLRAWDVATGRQLYSFLGKYGRFGAIAFSADGRALATTSQRLGVTLLDAATGDRLRAFEPPPKHGPFMSVAYSPDGQWLAAGCDKLARVWDARTHKLAWDVPVNGAGVETLGFASSRPWLAIGGRDGWVRLCSVPGSEEFSRFHATQRGRAVATLAVAPDGQLFGTTGSFHRLNVWQVNVLP